MKRKTIFLSATIGIIVIALGAIVYAQYFRPLRIWVDGHSWRVSGPGTIDTVTVNSYLKEHADVDSKKNGGTVGVPLWGTDGSIGLATAPYPERTGKEVRLSGRVNHVFEAVSSNGETWVYEVKLSQ